MSFILDLLLFVFDGDLFDLNELLKVSHLVLFGILVVIFEKSVLTLPSLGTLSLGQVAWEVLSLVLGLFHQGKVPQSELVGQVLNVFI